MKFVHCADCHLDGFRDQKLSILGEKCFTQVIDFAIEKEVDFFIIAGDLFNSALPRVDSLKFATTQLKRLQEMNVPVYAIAGSHDFSPQGKTMLDVLEIAGLLTNVMKGELKDDKLILKLTLDKKTNVLLTGINGRKGMLDAKQYKDIIIYLPKGKESIFLFHTALDELKPSNLEKMESTTAKSLPPGFSYYAGGHVHIVDRYSDAEHKNVIYPGPTFPNSFSELEELKKGSFVYYDSTKTKPIEHIYLEPKKIESFTIDANDKTSGIIEDEIKSVLEKNNLEDKIILLRVKGTIDGKVQEINFKELFQFAYQKGAYIILKNTFQLSSKLFEEVSIENTEDIEGDTIKEHLGQIPIAHEEEATIKALLNVLNTEQMDGEKKTTFTERISSIVRELIEP